MKKIIGTVLASVFVVTSVHSEESARCIEESSEKNFTDAAIKCALPNSFQHLQSLFSTNPSPLDEDTPVQHIEIAGDKNLTNSRPWQAPDFSKQEKTLGYSENAFKPPAGMEKQVQFWIDIYTKYETTQGLIHDSANVERVYEAVDFTDIMANKNLSEFAKEKLKQKRVDEIKKKYVSILEKLKTVTKPEELSSDVEKKIWKYFENETEPNKFFEAAQKGRLRFQLGQKDRMLTAIYFSGRYIQDMEKIFRDNNLPIELTRLVFVESSFNVLARSKVGASGLWQIMPYTAKPYRMISSAVDKRNSPLEATKLAAKLLKDNYKMLEAWPLAVTGYNHGPAGVKRLTLAYKTRNLAELVENVKSSSTFGFASRNFYASFLAALEVEKNALKYFEKVVWSDPLKGQNLKLPINIKYQDLLSWFDNNDEIAQVFNPHLTRQVTKKDHSIPANTVLFVPAGRYSQILTQLSKKDRSVATEIKDNTKVEISEENKLKRTYKVAPGDTIFGIAKDFGVKVEDLLAHNEIQTANKILPGQLLKIP